MYFVFLVLVALMLGNVIFMVDSGPGWDDTGRVGVSSARRAAIGRVGGSSPPAHRSGGADVPAAEEPETLVPGVRTGSRSRH